MKVRTITLLGFFFLAACTSRGSRPSEMSVEPTPTAIVVVPTAPAPAVGASSGPSLARDTPASCPAPLSSIEVQRALAELGGRTLGAVETGDFEGLARIVHPSEGLALGTFGTISHRISPDEVRHAPHDKTPRFWDGSSNMGDGPIELTYGAFLRHLRSMAYSKADTVGYGEVVQEDTLCGDDCVAKDIATAFPCAPFIQYDHSTGSKHNPGMWHFVVVAFGRDDAGHWKVIGLLEDAWSP